MLYIKKGKIPPQVAASVIKIKHSVAWKTIRPEDTKTVRDCFDRLPKDKIRNELIKEQRGLCAYCMRKLINDGAHTSIEHWMPLSKNKDEALSYSNMLGVCDGGRLWKGEGKRILSCDACKGDENEITISPYNKQHMKKIAYKSDGTLYTEPYDQALQHDIDHVLRLNGKLDKAGHLSADTATELVRGRRDKFNSCRDFFCMLDKRGKCTSLMVKKRIDEIKRSPMQPEFAGVTLFVLEQKYRQLKKRGL